MDKCVRQFEAQSDIDSDGDCNGLDVFFGDSEKVRAAVQRMIADADEAAKNYDGRDELAELWEGEHFCQEWEKHNKFVSLVEVIDRFGLDVDEVLEAAKKMVNELE